MNAESQAFRSRTAWVFGLVAVAATAAALAGLPPGMAPALRTNLALALGLVGLSVWWGVAVYATRGSPVRASSWLALAGAVAGAAAAVGLVLGGLRWIPPSLAYRSLRLFAIETPLWAIALLAWPSRPRPSGATNRGLLLALDVVTLCLAAGLLFWDFLIRPAGGIPPKAMAQLALAPWGLVLLSLGSAALRGSRPELHVAFWFLALSLAVTFVGNYLVAIIPGLPARLLVAFGVVTLLLRLGAADALLSPPAPDVPSRGLRSNGVPWFAGAAVSLVLLHLMVAPPQTGRVLLVSGVVGLILLLLARRASARLPAA